MNPLPRYFLAVFFLAISYFFGMTNAQQFNLIGSLVMLKRAGMEKMIEAIGDYRPFNTSDSWKGSLAGGGAGAALGALLGGGGALVSDLLSDEEEKRSETAGSVLKGIGGGALTGGAIGAGLPLLPPALLPHLSRLAGEWEKREWEKEHGDKGFFQKLLNSPQLGDAHLVEPGLNLTAPQVSIRDLANSLLDEDAVSSGLDKAKETARRFQ